MMQQAVDQKGARYITDTLWMLMESGTEEVKVLQSVTLLLTTNTVVHGDTLARVCIVLRKCLSQLYVLYGMMLCMHMYIYNYLKGVSFVRYEGLTAVKMWILTISVLTPYGLVVRYQCFRESYSLLLHIWEAPGSNLGPEDGYPD